MKANVERIKLNNDEKFLADLKTCKGFWIHSASSGLFTTSKKEVIQQAEKRKITYEIYTCYDGKLIMTIF